MNEMMILELWNRVKAFVPKKERLQAADALCSVLDEFGMIDLVADDAAGDLHLRQALAAYINHEDYDEDYDGY